MAANPDVKPTSTEQVEAGMPNKAAPYQHVEGNALLVDKHGKIRKLPVPSSNPNDPLNFKSWEKCAVIFCCCWFSIMSLSLSSGLGAILSVFFELYGEQGYDPNQVALLLTLPSLCIGLGNYIIIPLSLAIGRRPVLLVATVVILAATIGAATQNSYNAHLGTRVVLGLATGATESLLPLMLTEVTFLHQRGPVFGLYWMVNNIFGSMLNLATSYENAALGWRWCYWVYVITLGAGLMFAFFGAFETRFSRSAISIDGCVIVTDDFGVTRVIPDNEAQEYLDRMGAQVPDEAALAEAEVPRRSYLQKLKPWSEPHPHPWRMIIMSLLRMAQSLTSPAILYAVLLSSITLGCIVDFSLTYAGVLLGYGWPPESLGLINIGSVIGTIIGTLYCSFPGEWFVLWMARRNHGVHKPEHRLIVLVPPACLGIAMLVVYGVTSAGGSTWWGPVLAWTFFQITFVAVLIITTTFATEASPKHPGPALVMVMGTKNIISFGVTYSLTPMVASGGIAWAFGVLAGIFGAIYLLGIPVYLLNPKWRRYATRVEEKRGVVTSD